MLATEEPVHKRLRAALRVGGISIAHQQVGLAQMLSCKRIVCLAASFDAELIALQHDVEAHGIHFNIIDSPRALSGLINSGDEVIVLADGLLADAHRLAEYLDAGEGVLVQPVETGIAAGFERIDLEWASAGAMRIPGRLVDRLADLPGDVDVVSSLTRIALQAGVPKRQMPAGEAVTASLVLIRSDAEAHAAETAWFARNQAGLAGWSPTNLLARLLSRRIGPILFESHAGTRGLLIGAVAATLLALCAGWFGYPVIALCLCVLSWLVWQTRQAIGDVTRQIQPQLSEPWWAEQTFAVALDAAIVAIAGWGGLLPRQATGLGDFFAPAMVLGLARILPRLFDDKWVELLQDRAVLSIAFGAALTSVHAGSIIQIVAILLGLLAIAWPRGSSQLTPP